MGGHKHGHRDNKGTKQVSNRQSPITVTPPTTNPPLSSTLGQATQVLYGPMMSNSNNNQAPDNPSPVMPYSVYGQPQSVPSVQLNEPGPSRGSYNMYTTQGQPQGNMAANTHSTSDNLQNIMDLLSNVTNRLSNIEHNQNNRFGSIEQHFGYIEQQVSQIGSIKQSMSVVEARISGIDNELSQVKRKVSECEVSMGCMSDMCDEVLKRKTETDTAISGIHNKMAALDVDTLRQQNDELSDKILDLQCKSMEDSLLFTGIKEPDLQHGDSPENVQETLCDFLRTEMDIHSSIEFEYVQRRGRFNPQHRYPRVIIGKFNKRSDRDIVKRAAPGQLRSKPHFGVRELYPQEIEQKRKLLYPIMKRLKQNRDNRVNLYRDRLYLNGREYFPTIEELYPPQRSNSGFMRTETSSNSYRQSFDRNPSQAAGVSSDTYRSAWSFPDRPGSHQPIMMPPQTPTSNRFDALTGDRNDNGGVTFGAPGKQKARSPLECDQAVKKQRDDAPLANRVSTPTNNSVSVQPGDNLSGHIVVQSTDPPQMAQGGGNTSSTESIQSMQSNQELPNVDT